jgi:hypothetical protein
MFKMPKAPPARQVAKWCAYGLALAAPGSFVVLPLWLLRRHRASLAAWKRSPPKKPGG